MTTRSSSNNSSKKGKPISSNQTQHDKTLSSTSSTNKHKSTVREEELKQLQSYVRKRTQDIDAEIHQIREKLKTKGLNETMKSLPSSTTSMFGNSSLFQQSLKDNASGKTKLSSSIENDSIMQMPNITGLGIDGKGINKVVLDPPSILTKSKDEASKYETNTNKIEKLKEKQQMVMTEDERDHLITLLAKLKLKSEDAGYSPEELRELLLASDLHNAGETLLPINEVTTVLQTDLVLPITKQDQLILLQEYGYSNGLIDVGRMLADAGLWDDFDYQPNRSLEYSPERKRNNDRNDLDRSPSPALSPSKFNELFDERSISSPNLKQTKQKNPTNSYNSQQNHWEKQEILDQTQSTLSELNQLHNLIMEEEEFDEFTDQGKIQRIQKDSKKSELDKLTDELLPMEKLSEKARIKPPLPRQQLDNTATSVRNDKDPFISTVKDEDDISFLKPHATGYNTLPPPSSSSASSNEIRNNETNKSNELHLFSRNNENEKLKQLENENSKLKEEIKAFDSHFFEELEDLKFRYSRLQEIIGEDPIIDNSLSKSLSNRKDVRLLSPNSKELPLNRLSWSARNSMRAIDKANYASPLVQGRRGLGTITAPSSSSVTSGTYRSARSLSPTRRSTSLERDRGMLGSYEMEDSILGGRGTHGFSSSRTSQTRDKLLLSSRDSQGNSIKFEGGSHGIGDGRFSIVENEFGGNFANLCERRLVFELSSQPNPAEVTNALVHKVMDVAQRNRAQLKDPPVKDDNTVYITVKQLQEILNRLGLGLAPKEIEVLATGFASDGKGGIDAREFCEMIHSLVYNLIGNHFRHGQGDTLHSRRGNRSGLSENDVDDEIKREELLNLEYQKILRELCEGIVTYDRKAVLGASTDFFRVLIKPFIEMDLKGSGVICFGDFCVILKELGAMLPRDDYKLLARPYIIQEMYPESAYPSSNLNHLESFRHTKLTGSLRGKAKTNASFHEFMEKHGIHSQNQGFVALEDIEDESLVYYSDFVRVLADMLDTYIEKEGGLPVQSSLPWVIKEFSFVDILLSQLESMSSIARRKTLITLQYALENADINGLGELDGFAVLSALLNSGFRLQRYHRVQLLKAAEEYGGQLEYSRLVLTLLHTAVSWSQTERGIIYKVLKSMGNTVNERRLWLAKLKKELMERTSQTNTRSKAKYLTTQQQQSAGTGLFDDPNNKTNPRLKSLKSVGSGTSLSENALASNELISNLQIPPTVFLHVLRDLNCQLLPEEEAILLDCLDTERIAKLHTKKLHHKDLQSRLAAKSMRAAAQMGGGGDGDDQDNATLVQARIHSMLWNNDDDSQANPNRHSRTGQLSDFQMPMIDYYSFVQFVARHCGRWIDSQPELYDLLIELISNLSNPLQAIQELNQLFLTFDDKYTNNISFRSFLICAHRSRLLCQLDEKIINSFAEVLIIDGAGLIYYPTFILELKGIYTMIEAENHENQGKLSGKSTSNSIIQQLLSNGSDATYHTIIPIRNYLLKYCDYQSEIITMKEINALLREFSIIYQAKELDAFLAEISNEMIISADDDNHFEDSLNSSVRGGGGGIGSGSGMNKFSRVIDMKRFVYRLMNSRPNWMERHPNLVKKLLKSFIKISKEMSNVEKQSKEDLAMRGAAGGSATSLMMNPIEAIEEEYTDADLRDYIASLENASGEHGSQSNLHTMELINTKVIMKIISRINAFALEDYDTYDPSVVTAAKKGRGSSGGGRGGGGAGHSNQDITSMLQSNQQGGTKKAVKLIEWNIFDYILKSLGIYLNKTEIQFLCDACDPLPEASRINPYLLLDLLSIYKSSGNDQTNSSGSGGYGQSLMRGANKDQHSDDLTEAAKYALEHLQFLLYKAKDANQLPSSSSSTSDHSKKRPIKQWILDIRCIFRGFDYLNNGFIDLNDLSLILRLLNVTISNDLLADIPFISFQNQLVNYQKLLSYLLDFDNIANNPFYLKQFGNTNNNKGGGGGRGGKGAVGSEDTIIDDDADEATKYLHKVSSTRFIQEQNQRLLKISQCYPLQLLISRIRQNISIFILNNHNLEEAWLELLKIFQQFDRLNRNYVTSRDFLLAISVLLTNRSSMTTTYNNTDLLFSKKEWEEILSFFVIANDQLEDGQSSRIKKTKNSTTMAYDDHANPYAMDSAKINYLLFCEMILNPKEIEKKMLELKKYQKSANSTSHDDLMAHEYQLEKGKSMLGSSTTLRRAEGGGSGRGGSTPGRPGSAPIGRHNQKVTNEEEVMKHLTNDLIVKRFQESNDKYMKLMSHGKDYGSSGSSRRGEAAEQQARPYSASLNRDSRSQRSNENFEDEYLRSSRTMGQSSRSRGVASPKASSSSSVAARKSSTAGAGRGKEIIEKFSIQDLTGEGSHRTQSAGYRGEAGVSRAEINAVKQETARSRQQPSDDIGGRGSGIGSSKTQHLSRKDLYNSSHGGGNRSVRFNWTN